MLKIQVINSVYSRTDKIGRRLLAPCLFYRTSFWKKTKYKKIEQQYEKILIDDSGVFLTGFIPRIIEFCERKKIPFEISGWQSPKLEANEKNFQKFLKKVKTILGEDFRPEQLERQVKLIKQAVKSQRGILLSPTGTGKTTLSLGIASLFPKLKVLYLCHTKAIVSQTAVEFKKFGFKTTRILEGGKDQSGNVVVATRQSARLLNLMKYDILMIDEIHKFPDINCEYGKICEQIEAPIRIGFTATMSQDPKGVMASEGHIGPVVGEITMKEAEEMDILSKTKLRIVRVPKQFIESKKYNDVHEEAIVTSRVRNRLIAEVANDYVKNGMSVLIFITKIKHAENIVKIGKKIFNLKIQPIVSSGKLNSNADEKEQIKQDFKDKKIMCVVSSSVWKEGVNIPSLDVIILADIGKKDPAVIQAIGRGKRKTARKTVMIVVDLFDDCSTHLIKQFGYRITLYSQLGWL